MLKVIYNNYHLTINPIITGKKTMQAEKIGEDLYWVGAKDWNLREFHGYATPLGSTYNAYLIMDEKKVLVDTVKHYCTDEMLVV